MAKISKSALKGLIKECLDQEVEHRRHLEMYQRSVLGPYPKTFNLESLALTLHLIRP
jgi:hypothetical protein